MGKRKVRLAFVGSGGMAEAHSKALSTVPGVEILGYCDVKLKNARARAEKYGGQAFNCAEEMLDKVEPDAVYVCLPPFAHGVELELVRRGIPFFIEKPIGIDMSLTRRIVSAVKRKNLITSVGYMNRYRKSVQTAKKLFAKDTPILVLGGWIGATPIAKGEGIWTWWVQKDKSGGQFLEQVTHTVDLARFICGEAVEVHAYSAKGLNTLTPKFYTIDDATVVNIKFKSGAVANLWACCSANAGGGRVSLSIYATKTTALFTGWDHSATILRHKKKTLEISGESEVFPIEDRAFLRAVRTGNPDSILCTYEDGAKTLAITVAANESMKTGKPVRP